MDKNYADTVRLLLAVAPEVFANDIFAMKGGTAINLFVQDMPRLSVDIDVVFRPWDVPRDAALAEINDELATIAQRVSPLGVQTRLIRSKDLADTKLIVENDTSQVKIEVNTVFRGTVLPVERKPLSARTSDLFGVEFDAPILAHDELYAGKLVAALDRQHPRDLFDVWQLFEAGGLTDGMVECFVLYLAGHNRPPHEVLFGNEKDIAAEYERAFVGMTEVHCPLETLLEVRTQLRQALPGRLTQADRKFLSGLVRAAPDWSLVRCQHAAQLPALRWKLTNLEAFRKRRPADFAAQADELDAGLGRTSPPRSLGFGFPPRQAALQAARRRRAISANVVSDCLRNHGDGHVGFGHADPVCFHRVLQHEQLLPWRHRQLLAADLAWPRLGPVGTHQCPGGRFALQLNSRAEPGVLVRRAARPAWRHLQHCAGAVAGGDAGVLQSSLRCARKMQQVISAEDVCVGAPLNARQCFGQALRVLVADGNGKELRMAARCCG
ncbi:MAG: hypothetical protein RLZZ182_526, partial [Pseudomonadota bacterium]